MPAPDGRPLLVAARPLGLGDLCTAVPALKALRRAFAEHWIALAAPEWQAQLTAGFVDEVVVTDEHDELGRPLHGAALAVNLHGRGPQSSRRLLATGPDRLLAFRHESIDATADAPRWDDDEHETRRWCRLLREGLGIDAFDDDLALPVPAVEAPVAPGTVIVHPGAKAAGRRWPARRFAAVVDALVDGGHPVAVTGTAAEADLCRRVAGSTRDDASVSVLAGRTTVAELAAAVSAANAVISNDTGVAHLASAYEVPSVVLFGPTSPRHWGPPARRGHRALRHGRGRGDPHSDELDPRLAAITVDEVLAAFEQVVGERWPQPIGDNMTEPSH